MAIKKYDWNQVQKDYDSGLSYRDIAKKYGMSQQSIANAKKRGDMKTRTRSEGGLLRFKNHPPHKMGAAARERQSKLMSENNPGGRSKWFEVAGKKVQGTWERDLALYFEAHNIIWERCKPMPYVIDDIKKNYTPDFYLPEQNLYVEVKGYWWGNDKKKMQAVIEQHQDTTFRIVEGEMFKQLIKEEIEW
ncbi:hypothetical protein KA005_04620 [bacterium]|nr:hypothetical protein [bacterium]